MKRRSFIAGTATLATTPSIVGSLSTALARSETLTDLAIADPEEMQPYGGDGNPSFVVVVEEGKRDSLREWVSSTDEASILREHDVLEAISITAPWDAVGLSIHRGGIKRTSGGLQAEDWVRMIDANVAMSYPDPVNLADSSVWNFELGFWESLRTSEPSSTGVAFDEDAPEATLAQSRAHTRASDTLVSGTDATDRTIAVVDTGCTDGPLYEDGSGNSRIVPESKNLITGETVGNDGADVVTADDSSEHGDWVGKCIAANGASDDVGFVPDADILALKALDEDGNGEIKDLVAAVEHAINNGATEMCLSLGSPQWSQALVDVLEEAVENDIFVAIAAGNDRFGTTFVACPASSGQGLAVQACNVPSSRDETKPAYFGCVGPHPGSQDFSEGKSAGATPDIAAPGMAVTVDGNTLSGTSMAAPHVVGAASLLRARESLTVEETIDRLTATAYPVEHFGATEAEHGLLDVQAAVDNAEPEDDPADVRNDRADGRDGFNETLSATRGNFLFG